MIDVIGYWCALTLIHSPVIVLSACVAIRWFWEKIYIKTEFSKQELPRWLSVPHDLLEYLLEEHTVLSVLYTIGAGSLQIGVMISSALSPTEEYLHRSSEFAITLAPYAWLVVIPLVLWVIGVVVCKMTIVSIRLSRKLKTEG